MSLMKLLELIRDQLQNKLGIGNIPFVYVFRASVVPHPIRDISPNLTYFKDTEGLHEELISCTSYNHPGYADDDAMVLEFILYFSKESII